MNARLDALFVVPGNLEQVYQVFAKDHAVEPPIFALWIASHLLKDGISVDFIDTVPLGLSPDEVAERVGYLNPRLVVVPVYGYQPSASTQNMPAARAVCQAIKNLRPDLKILITGTHPSALPERTLREEPVDFVCDGEGPVTISELVSALKRGGGFSEVESLWFRAHDNVIHTSPAQNVTELEFDPDIWRFLPMDRYIAHDWHCNYRDVGFRSPYASILTTLGCPYRCEFCCIQAPFKTGEAAMGMKPSTNSYRFWKPETVLKTLEVLAEKYGVTHVKIHDEMFVLNPRHVTNVCTLIKDRFGDSFNIWAYTRVDTTRPEFLELLRAAGIRWLGVGIEAASSTVRDGQDKSFTDEDIFRVVGRIKNAGINVGANYIFGLPSDTLESMQATLDMAIAINSPFANFYCAMAYPGSRLYSEAKSKGLSLADDPGGPGWIGYSQHAYETQSLPTDNLSAREVLAFRDGAWRKYYTRPEYLSMLETWYGEHGKEAVRNITEITSRSPLRRALLEGSASKEVAVA